MAANCADVLVLGCHQRQERSVHQEAWRVVGQDPSRLPALPALPAQVAHVLWQVLVSESSPVVYPVG